MSKQPYQRRLTVRRTVSVKENETKDFQDNLRDKQSNTVQYNLNDIITKTLSSSDPQCGKKIVYFNYANMKFSEFETDEKNYLVFLDLKSSVIHKDDKMFSHQEEFHKKKNLAKKKAKKECEEFKEDPQESIKSMRNKITYNERISQSINSVVVNQNLQTAPFNRKNMSGITHKWVMFDSYIERYIQEEEKKRREDEIMNYGRVRVVKTKKVEGKLEIINRPSMITALKLMEKQMIQIINFNEYKLFRDWHKQEETLEIKPFIPLLKFPEKGNKRKSVTSVVWHPKKFDLYAVSFGSYSFPKKKDKGDNDEINPEDEINEPGYVEIFSIKNNHYPEIKYKLEVGVLSLDFHPNDDNLLCAGLYDGSVAVFDIKQKTKAPILMCDIRTQKHNDPVWQVKWFYQSKREVYEKLEFTFFSISSDGKINKWTFTKNKNQLEKEEILSLKYSDVKEKPEENKNEMKEDETFVFGNYGGMCLDFNKHKGKEHLVVIGTEEGSIFLCSVKHRNHYIEVYEGHSMAVYSVTWNPYHDKVFLSCSADWGIKLWHYKQKAPLIIFDMQNPVGDIAWSPWCATIFGAVTVQGDIKFFDLNLNRKSSIFEKKYSDNVINHIAFNRSEYVFLTGDDKGRIRLWKMSEHIRMTVDKKEEEAKELEKQKNAVNKNSAPETKVNLPRNLINVPSKQKKKIEIKTENKSETINSEPFKKAERERIVEILKLLDIEDI